MDIGECANIHDLALRADYEQGSETKDYGYEIDVSFIRTMLSTIGFHLFVLLF